MPATINRKKYLSVQEIADKMGVSTSTIRRRMRENYYLIDTVLHNGKRVVWSRDIRYLAKRKR